MDKTDNNKKLILEKLQEAHGIITTACQNANLSRSQFYEWQNQDPDFKAAVEAVNEEAIDFVESKLFEKVNGVTVQGKGPDKEDVYYLPPSDTAIIFYLKTKAKKRGYVERQEITGADGKNVINELHVKIIRDKATGITPGEFTPQPTENTGSEETV